MEVSKIRLERELNTEKSGLHEKVLKIEDNSVPGDVKQMAVID